MLTTAAARHRRVEMWIDYEKQYREEREAIEAKVEKMRMKAIREQAEELQHKNQWSGLRGQEMTRFDVLKKEFQKRTGKCFFVPRKVYP